MLKTKLINQRFPRKTYDEEEVEQLIQINVSYVNDSEN